MKIKCVPLTSSGERLLWLRFGWLLARGRWRYRLSWKEARRVRGRILSAVGESTLSPGEAARLAKAAFANRSYARGERALAERTPHRLTIDGDCSFPDPAAGRLIFVAPRYLHAGAVWNRPLLEWARIPERGRADLMMMAPPLAGNSKVEEVVKWTFDQAATLLPLKVRLEGPLAYRLSLENPISLHKEAPRREQEREASERLGEFLDDALRDNPAQYDWFSR